MEREPSAVEEFFEKIELSHWRAPDQDEWNRILVALSFLYLQADEALDFVLFATLVSELQRKGCFPRELVSGLLNLAGPKH